MPSSREFRNDRPRLGGWIWLARSVIPCGCRPLLGAELECQTGRVRRIGACPSHQQVSWWCEPVLDDARCGVPPRCRPAGGYAMLAPGGGVSPGNLIN